MLVGGGVLRYPVRLRAAARDASRGLAFLERRFTPRTVFMEIGAAHSKVALRAAGYVERVYAVDVSGEFLRNAPVPSNLRLVLCDGVRIPVPEASIDLAFSGSFIDHLLADEVVEHLRSVRRSLAPGGEYVCVTSVPGAMRSRMLAAGFSAARIPLLSGLFGPTRVCATR